MVVDLIVTAVALIVTVSSTTSVVYSTAVLMGGGGAGQENALISQIWIGLMGLGIVHLSGVLW